MKITNEFLEKIFFILIIFCLLISFIEIINKREAEIAIKIDIPYKYILDENGNLGTTTIHFSKEQINEINNYLN